MAVPLARQICEIRRFAIMQKRLLCTIKAKLLLFIWTGAYKFFPESVTREGFQLDPALVLAIKKYVRSLDNQTKTS